jgi:hypothetical protein
MWETFCGLILFLNIKNLFLCDKTNFDIIETILLEIVT